MSEELKSCKENSNGYNKEDIELNKKAIYNKAIDDFKEELFKNSERVRLVGWFGYSKIVTCEKIYDIAEQLKVDDTE